MESTLYELEEEQSIRPVLLTVLCILTFIGSGWGIISGVYTYSMASRVEGILSSSGFHRQIAQDDSTIKHDSVTRHGFLFRHKMMLSVSKMLTEENIRKNATGEIISCLCTLCGALLMWRLRRSGFYFYMAGVIVGLAIPLYLYGNNF